MEEEESADRGHRRLSSLFLSSRARSENCHRCGRPVYQQERVGPVNEVIFHKQCFKCFVCGGHFTFKNYWTNQTSSQDREIYCQTHVPRIGGSRLDKTAVGIRGAMRAQDNFRKASAKMTELRLLEDQPVPSIDTESVGIKAALQQTRHNQQSAILDHKITIDENAVYIRGAMDAQMLQRRYRRQLDKHHYPPLLARKREKLFELQKRLEERLRSEEDALLREFRHEREKESQAINQEIDTEWEQQLKELTDKYMKTHKKSKDQDQKMVLQLEQEKKHLAATMTLKKEKKKNTATIRLRKQEQEQTARLVKEQSRLMLDMLAKEQQELKEQLVQEMSVQPSKSNPDMLLEHNTDELLGEALEIFSLPVAPPSPKAPSCRQEDLLPEPSVLELIDQHVIKVAESEQLTYTDLVRQLTEGLMTDLEKSRAIYRWICVKNLNEMDFADDVDVDTPMGLLRGIKMGTETYHVLFMRLCSYAGLHCTEIKGHSKSVGYEPGMKITPDTFQNTWNAVLIDGEWRLIQCNWGARHLVLKKDKEKKQSIKDQVHYQYDDHYFMTNPDEFIQEFWPHDPNWQLLEAPISLEEFESLPFVRSTFFHYNMRFENLQNAVIYTDDTGGAKISIRVPEQYESDLVFFYQLCFADKDRYKETAYKSIPLERYVFQTMVDNQVTFSCHVPTPGQYLLEIFATKITEDSWKEDGGSPRLKLKCACKFKIICEQQLSQKIKPLPDCAPGEWGPKKANRLYGLVLQNAASAQADMERAGLLSVEDNCQIKFKVTQPQKFLAKLRLNDVDSKTLSPFLNVTVEDSWLSVYVSLPQVGQYGLDLFARPLNAPESSSPVHVCKFLINCSQVTSQVHIPKIAKAEQKRSTFGPTPAFSEMGLKLISQKEPRISVKKPGALQIEVKVAPNVVLSYKFIREPGQDERASVQQSDPDHGLVQFRVMLSQKGNYMLSLYARRDTAEDKSSCNVFNYWIQLAPDSNEVPPVATSKSSSLIKSSLSKKSSNNSIKSNKSLDKSSK